MTFKATRITFIISFSAFLLLDLYFGIGLFWLLLPSSVFLVILIYGSAHLQSNFFTPALCSANITEKHIALTFDDGPNAEFTPDVLALLAQYHAPATFFVIGNNIYGNEKILKKIDAAGHSIGNHSSTHSYLIDFKTVQGFKDELNQTAELIHKIIGKQVTLFRPPYGVATPSLAKAATQLNYTIIGWSVRSLDTTLSSVQAITQRIHAKIRPGAIILFHDTSEKTLEALKQTLEFTKNNGYKVVSIEQLLKIDAYKN
jgi:peptidoglycan-N-acetylglucosamine deacetylase